MKPYPDIPYSHNSLKTFEAVARHLSFTDAALELNVTQSAVSRQVKQLEQGLKTQLVTRMHRSIELTARGSELFSVLQRNYQTVQALIESWHSNQQQRIVIKPHSVTPRALFCPRSSNCKSAIQSMKSW